MKKLFLVFSMLCVSVVFAGEQWAPSSGYSSVNQTKTYNRFIFASLADQYGDDDSYEQETQVYNNNYADYNGYWSSNLPAKYYDTPFLDDIDNFTIGSARAADLEDGKNYIRCFDHKLTMCTPNCKGCEMDIIFKLTKKLLRISENFKYTDLKIEAMDPNKVKESFCQ